VDASANEVRAGTGVVAVVARGVGKTKRVVENVAVPVELLRVGRVRHQHVGAQETAHTGQIKSGAHINQAQVVGPEVIVPVAGEAPVGDGLVGRGAPAAVELALRACPE
jgi:hypothetical protein